MDSFVVGVDFGTESVRAIVADTRNGEIVGEASAGYKRWSEGKYCEPTQHQFRQHPRDYLEGFETCIQRALTRAGHHVGDRIVGIAVDTTGSTPCPVNREGIPVALLPGFEANPNAMFHLWKDHTAIEEAKEFNVVASTWGGVDYTKFQGTYSSEWFWAKILHTSRIDAQVSAAAWSWVEHCDWIPALLTGNTTPANMYRSSCAAGHKALWHSAFNGLPERAFLERLSPYLAEVAAHYGGPPRPSIANLGRVTAEWAARLGLDRKVIVGGSSLDAHAGAVAAGVGLHTLVKIIGTSTVDMLLADAASLRGKDLRAICGQAEDSIIPGYIGIEAGQAAFGDVYAWLRDVLLWSVHTLLPSVDRFTVEEKHGLEEELFDKLLPELMRQAEQLPGDETDLVALDWLNGRRYPHINEHVKAAISGIHLGTSVPQLFKALVLGTAFGSRRILDSFVSKGLEINHIIAAGGISQKSPYVMQILADVLNRPISVCASQQTCAKGAAMYAAVACGQFETLEQAQATMGDGFLRTYIPDAQQRAKYDQLYQRYGQLGVFVEQSAD